MESLHLRRTDTRTLHTPDRSDRIFEAGAGWYYKTREGKNRGPFKDEFAARSALEFMKITKRWHW